MQADPTSAAAASAAQSAFARPTTSFDRTPAAAAQPAEAVADGVAQVTPVVRGTEYVTGAYQPSGDPAIDRMLQLERALKQFGSPF